MTITSQLLSPGNNVIKMLTGDSPVSSDKSGKRRIRKSRAFPDENLSGQENSPSFFRENPCCFTKPERKTFSTKNNRATFIRIFSELYAGVYEIK